MDLDILCLLCFFGPGGRYLSLLATWEGGKVWFDFAFLLKQAPLTYLVYNSRYHCCVLTGMMMVLKERHKWATAYFL